MFQFPAFAPSTMMVHGLQPCGLPHSDISGSRPVCGSPELFAAYHVLHRFRKTRHPPFALVLFLFVNHETTSSRLSRFAFEEIVVPNNSRKNFGLIQTIVIFFLYLVISLSIVNELLLPSLSKGMQRYTFFFTHQIFFTIFFFVNIFVDLRLIYNSSVWFLTGFSSATLR